MLWNLLVKYLQIFLECMIVNTNMYSMHMRDKNVKWRLKEQNVERLVQNRESWKRLKQPNGHLDEREKKQTWLQHVVLVHSYLNPQLVQPQPNLHHPCEVWNKKLND